MSMSQVQKTLETFAAAPVDMAIVLKGPWGTGKTFLWDSIVKQKKERFHQPRYCYVSLFGINSLTELKRSIFENSVSKDIADTPPTLTSLGTNLESFKSSSVSFFRKLTKFGADAVIPHVKGLGGVIESFQYFALSGTTICIDDFERKGSALTDRDVLGLVSNLVEKKKCRVILILNDKTLKPDAEFFSFSEKVFDYEVLFNPSVDEAISLVFNSGSENERKLIQHLKALKINNIRLLKKVEFFLKSLDTYFDVWKVEVTNQALHVLPLAVLAIYGGKETLADVDIITSLEQHHMDLLRDTEGKKSEEKAAHLVRIAKVRFLSEYGFGACDEFDMAIIALVKQGYPDDENLGKITDAIHKQVEYDRNFAILKSAWALFRDSFEDNEAEIFTHFESALALTLPNLSVMQLDDIALVYQILDEELIFNNHVAEYFKLADGQPFLSSEENLGRAPKHPFIVHLLDKHNASLVVSKTLFEILENWPEMKSLKSEDIHTLSNATADEFYKYFKLLKPNEPAELLGKCLELGASGIGGLDFQQSHSRILCSSYEAVMKIASESKLNERRTLKFILGYRVQYEAAKLRIAGPKPANLGSF